MTDSKFRTEKVPNEPDNLMLKIKKGLKNIESIFKRNLLEKAPTYNFLIENNNKSINYKNINI